MCAVGSDDPAQQRETQHMNLVQKRSQVFGSFVFAHNAHRRKQSQYFNLHILSDTSNRLLCTTMWFCGWLCPSVKSNLCFPSDSSEHYTPPCAIIPTASTPKGNGIKRRTSEPWAAPAVSEISRSVTSGLLRTKSATSSPRPYCMKLCALRRQIMCGKR